MTTALTPSPKPRIAIGGILHETHSFAEPKTSLAHFQRQALHYGDRMLEALTGARSAIGGMIQGATESAWTLLPTAYGAAMPSGIVVESAYQTILDELLNHLSAAMPVDGVLLALHGAMVTEEHLDPETHILEEVRKVVGSQTPIVVVLDMHGNISPQTTTFADVLVAFDTNPHIDPHARGLESVAIMKRLLEGALKPTAAHVAVPMLLSPQATGTDDLPLRAVHARAAEMESDPCVIAICVMGGFAYADTPNSGASIIVTTNDDAALAEQYAQELAAILWQQRHAALPNFLLPHAAITQALIQPGGPILLVDSADNIGGGTPGDGTDALRAMLDLNVHEGTIVLADAEAVALCWAAGEQAEVTLAVGGKTDQWHGAPIHVTAVVRKLSSGIFRCELPENHFASFYGTTVDMGHTVWLRVQGVNIVLTERKTPPFDLAQLRVVGLNPEEQKMIVVKSAVAYRAAYLPIAAAVVEMDCVGLCTANLERFPYVHLRRPLFPLDEVPELIQITTQKQIITPSASATIPQKGVSSMDRHNQLAIEFKRRANRGEVFVGGWHTLYHPSVSQIMARAGLDFVIIDSEHEAINPETLPFVLSHFANSASLPVMRVAWADKVLVKHALDAGARALLFPMINSVDEAAKAVSYCHYPPRGVRGFGPGAASNLYDDLQPYLDTIGEAINVWVQIEHIDAVEHAEAIARVEGVDALFIGPADLSATMGMLLDFDRLEFQQVIERVVAAGRRAGKLVVMAVDDTAEKALERLGQGIQAVTIGDDRLFLRQGTQAALHAVRSHYPAKANL